MMAFMAPILAHGVAESPRSGYPAPPDRSDHPVYGIGHMLYSRWSAHGNHAETDEKPYSGHPPTVRRRDTTRPERRMRPVVRASARIVHMRVRRACTRRRRLNGRHKGPRRE
ncbi:hypothetical protein GCM10022206_42730 [Streptomyces chiangmaiensis]